MYAYKFRVAYDEVTDFVRDIEILCTDNFENFHKILLEAIGLKGNELASFYACDAKWNKQNEITLMNMGEEEGEEEEIETPDYDSEDEFAYKSKLPKFVMQEACIKNFIEDPHQNILYEYDFINPKHFFIELLKTFRANEEIEYPRCTFKAKELPMEVINDLHNGDEFGMDDFDFNDDDFDAFDDDFDDDDLMGFGSTDEYSDIR